MLVDFDFTEADICVVRFRGRFVTGVDIDYLRQRADELKGTGCRKIVADFSGVPYLDSTGIGFIVYLYTTLAKSGGRLVLACPGARVKQVLELTRLHTILMAYDDEASAVAAMRAWSPSA
ncbi:MAG: STAS domain-containing protein [Bryobacteraceae bacterium]